MNIVTEKEEIIKRLNQVEDISVIDAVKDLLDFAQTMNDNEPESELDIAIKQSDKREVRPHHIVWDEIRKKYKK